jgi:nitroreductase
MISKDQPSIADDPSIISAFYGAPTVITLFGPRNFLYTEADCYIMANNICLAAYSLGVGSCIMGRAEETFESELGSAMQKEWGVTENFEAKVHITLGYPKDGFPQSKNRKYPNPIVIRDEVE